MVVLLGLRLEEERIVYLAQIFGELMSNLFSLPIDAPFSGLRRVRLHSQRWPTAAHQGFRLMLLFKLHWGVLSSW